MLDRDPPRLDPITPQRDSSLVRAVLAGDRRAARTLAVRLRCVPRILMALNRRRGGHMGHHDLEDLAQDTLATIWEKLETFHGQVTLEHWTHRFCFLKLMNRMRKGARRDAVEGQRLENHQAEEGGVQRDEELFEALEARLARLSQVEADAVRLKHYEQCTFEEIGERMQTSPNTAKTRYYRALRRIAQEMRGELEEDGA